MLVLAGGSLAGKTLGPSPLLNQQPAELPDGSGLALDHIGERLANQTDLHSLMVVVDANHPPLRPIRHSNKWHWVSISPQASVLASLEAALESVTTDQVLIQPITTLPPASLPQGCWIGLGDQPMPRENWSAVSAIDSDQPHFHPKRTPASPQEPESHPFTGFQSTHATAGVAGKQTPAALVVRCRRQDLLSLAQPWCAETPACGISLAGSRSPRHSQPPPTGSAQQPWFRR